MQSPQRPLSGVRVLDLSRLLPGPFSTLILSDLGARVDKLEDTHAGDYMRLFPPLVEVTRDGATERIAGRFAAINRDKRSICLDLKNPAGRDALLRLLPGYDVLIESFRPGVLARLGLSVEALHACNPRLVVCSISGYGQDGPYRDRAGHDLNYLALAGVLAQSGPSPEAPPHPLPVQLADLGAGALWAVVQVLAALRAAEHTGKGCHLDVSMCEGSLSFLLPDLGNLEVTQQEPPRGADLLTGGVACYRVYTTRDGKFLSVAALEPKFWLALNQVLGRAADVGELVAPPAEQARIAADIQARIGQHTRDEWAARFSQADACVEPVLTPLELKHHPLHAARRVFFSTTPGRDGETALPQVRTPALPADAVAQVRPPPRQGEHTADILREAGFSDEEIGALRTTGAAR